MSGHTGHRDFAAYTGLETFFYCIGAQKTATTWLYVMLKQHPECLLAPVKEVRFWDNLRLPGGNEYAPDVAARWVAKSRADASAALKRLRFRTWRKAQAGLRHARRFEALVANPRVEDYISFVMADYSGERVAGEMTPAYALLESETYAEMADLHPQSRFIFMMRDPVERLWSGIRHRQKLLARHEGVQVDDAVLLRRFETALDDPMDPDRRQNDYPRTIRALEAAVPQDRILYLFYETLFDESEIARIEKFLGLPGMPVDREARFNIGIKQETVLPGSLRQRAREVFEPVYDFVADRFGGAVPRAWQTEYAA